ncbi:MAG TPA: NrtA/SsuA/CpmA family ABC transporter substrate-binding protein [Acidimicrobiales bacterium]|nr:NrtA/SsuA/CpmA family ABC transporter substrate-binding protein [Acidimicrobiales bacterium]
MQEREGRGQRPGEGLTRRRLLGLAGAGVVGLALAGCGDDQEETSTGSQGGAGTAQAPSLAGQTVSVAAYSKNHASSPLFWQKFAPEGLKVEVKIFTSGSDMNRAMEAGDLDFGLFGMYNGLIEKEQGFRSKIISMAARRGMGLAARADRGLDSIDDLRGKTIAVPPPGLQVLALTYLLSQAGMQLDRDVKSVPLGYADHAAALERGEIDAYMGTEPPVTQSVVSGVGKRLVDPATTPIGDFNTAIWASPRMLEQPDLLRAAAQMQRDAAEYLTPGGVNDRAVWKDLLVSQFGYTEAVYNEVLSNIGAVWRFDEARRRQVEAAGALMRSTGVLKKDPDYSQVFALEYQPSA